MTREPEEWAEELPEETFTDEEIRRLLFGEEDSPTIASVEEPIPEAEAPRSVSPEVEPIQEQENPQFGDYAIESEILEPSETKPYLQIQPEPVQYEAPKEFLSRDGEVRPMPPVPLPEPRESEPVGVPEKKSTSTLDAAFRDAELLPDEVAQLIRWLKVEQPSLATPFKEKYAELMRMEGGLQ